MDILLPSETPLSAFINLTSWSYTLKAERGHGQIGGWMVSTVPDILSFSFLCFMSRPILSVPVFLLHFHFA